MGRYYGYNMLISFFDLQARAELERKENGSVKVLKQ